MINDLPAYINIIFIATVLGTWCLFLYATRDRLLARISVAWLVLTGLLAFRGYYLNTDGIPPRFIFSVLPVLIAILVAFNTRSGKRFIDQLELRYLTLISIVRIPVEIVLYLLFIHKAVPELMTFAGRNFDIIAGITAPIVYYYCFIGKKVKHKSMLLAWNILSLGLLINIVVNAVLSAPFRFQQFGFNQPNKAILYFPFIWLPSFVVMVVLFSHLVSIRRLVYGNKDQPSLQKI
jgi:hypothetical protein